MRRSVVFLLIALGVLALGFISGAFEEVYAMAVKPKFAGEASPYDDIINKYATQYGVDPLLIRAIIRQESNWRPDVIGFDGLSIGLMQITLPLAQDFFGHPVTFDDIKDPDVSIHIGTWYLAKLAKYGTRGQIASYNEGPGNWLKGRTNDVYVNSVLGYYNAYALAESEKGTA